MVVVFNTDIVFATLFFSATFFILVGSVFIDHSLVAGHRSEGDEGTGFEKIVRRRRLTRALGPVLENAVGPLSHEWNGGSWWWGCGKYCHWGGAQLRKAWSLWAPVVAGGAGGSKVFRPAAILLGPYSPKIDHAKGCPHFASLIVYGTARRNRTPSDYGCLSIVAHDAWQQYAGL